MTNFYRTSSVNTCDTASRNIGTRLSLFNFIS